MTSIQHVSQRELVVGQVGEILLDPLSHGGDVAILRLGYEVLSVAYTLVTSDDCEIEVTCASVRYLSCSGLNLSDIEIEDDPKFAGTVEVWWRGSDHVWQTTSFPQDIDFVEWDSLHEMNNQVLLDAQNKK